MLKISSLIGEVLGPTPFSIDVKGGENVGRATILPSMARERLLVKVVIDVNMELLEMENILVMSMNLMQSLGTKDVINENAKVALTL